MYEKQYVQDTYEEIADRFDHTRYSIWENVRLFIESMPSNSTVLDAGCGNGKTMLYRKDLNFYGIDKCKNFVNICKSKDLNVYEADILQLPFENNSFDYVICTAVIHHLESFERRKKAISELYRVLKPNGKLLISVWFNIKESIQATKKKVEYLGNNDYLIPWGNNKFRYYHFMTFKELSELFNDYKYDVIISYGNFFITISK